MHFFYSFFSVWFCFKSVTPPQLIRKEWVILCIIITPTFKNKFHWFRQVLVEITNWRTLFRDKIQILGENTVAEEKPGAQILMLEYL